MLLSRSCGFTCKKNFEGMIVNGGSHGRVEIPLGSGQGTIVTRTPNSIHTCSSGIGSDITLVIWYIGSDVVLTPGNIQAYPNCSSCYFIPKH